MRIYDGTAFLVHRTGAKVVTCYLRNAVRVKWVRHKGWTQWFPRVSVHFSPPLRAPNYAHLAHNEARRKITQWLRDQVKQSGAAAASGAVAAGAAAARRRRVDD